MLIEEDEKDYANTQPDAIGGILAVSSSNGKLYPDLWAHDR